MRLLRSAIENQRWDLAAHAIVLASAQMLNSRHRGNNKQSGDKPNVSQSREKKGRPQGQSER